MRASLCLVLLSTTAGCHARFKKNVGSIDDVRPQILVGTGPSVVLGGASGTDVVSSVVNVVQAVRSIDAAGRLAEAVDVEGVNSSFASGLERALGEGPPFGTSSDRAASLLEVEVVSYGLEAPVMGMAGTFNYDLHVSIYLPDGKKVYNTHQSCNVGFGQASAVSQALGTVNNVKQLDQMSDAEVQAVFEGAAAMCGEQLVMRMRKHASSNGSDGGASAAR